MIADPARRSSFPPGLPRAALAAILALAALLRVAALDKPLYVDEISSITVASRPLAGMSEAMREIDASPALYPLLLHGWMGVSRADSWVRLLSAMCGWLAVVVVVGIATRVFGWRAGLGAGFIMAIAPAHVHYAQYVRSYSLFTCLAAVHVWLFIDWYEARTPFTVRRAAVVVAVTTALLYTHYLSVLLFAGEAVVVAFRLWSGFRVRGWVAAMVVAGVLFLPGLPLLLHNAAFDRVRNADRPDPLPLYRTVPNLAGELVAGQRSLGFDKPVVRRATLAVAALLFPVLWLTGALRAGRDRRDMVLLLTAVSLLPIAVYLLSGRKLVAVRFFVPFAPGFIVILGAGLAALPRVLRIAAVVALTAVAAVPLAHFYSKFSWSYDHRRVASAIRERSQPGDVILVVHPYEAFFYRWYLGSTLPIRGLLFTPLEEQEVYVIKPAALTLEHARSRIEGAASRHPRMWIVGQSMRSFASDAQEEARVLAWMDQTFRRADDLSGLTGADPVIRLYERRAGSPPRGTR